MPLNTALIRNRLKAASGMIAINSPNAVEDELVSLLLKEVAQDPDTKQPMYKAYYWNLSKSLCHVALTKNENNVITGNRKIPVSDYTPDNPVTGFLKYIRDCQEQALFIAANLHEFLPGGLQANIYVLQDLIDLCREIKRSNKRVILIGDRIRLSHHFDGSFLEIDNPLPDEAERRNNLDYRLKDIKRQCNGKVRFKLTEPGTKNLVRAMGGLPKEEADDLLLEAAITHQRIDDETAEFIKQRRSNKLKKRGIDILEPPSMRAVGLDNLDAWLDRKAKMFDPVAQEYGLDLPNGCLIVGPPGTGKTLAVRNMAKAWEMPTFVLNIGRMMDRHVGGSEENLDQFLKEIESQTGILFIDELDKQFAAIATGASGGDGGTSQRLFGTFLTWLNDKREKRIPIFVAATANRIDHLPSEFLRDGRWDAKFYVGLPKRRARSEILAVHLERRKIHLSEVEIAAIVAKTSGFNGAELEQLVITCAEQALIAGKPGQVSSDELLHQAEIAPVQSRNPTSQAALQELEAWAKKAAIPASLEIEETINEADNYERKPIF